MKKRVLSLLLCLVMVLSLPPAALAATVVDRVKVSMTAPTVGKPLPQNLKTSSDSSAELTGFQWEGELDGDGNMMGGTNYTLTFSLKIKSGKSATFPKNNSTLRVVFNGTLTATITELSSKEASGTLTFFINERGKMEKPAVKKDLAWSLAEASKVENHPLGSPITLVVNEETLRESDYFVMDFDAYPYLTTDTIIYQLYVGAGPKLHTLDGETIVTKGVNDIDGSSGHAVYHTYHHYRINRVVYDWSRADDPSLDRFPNCTELWLSPKCDIDGILKTLGNITLDTQWIGDFFEWNCTVFIPDSLYPNGPTYTDHPAPGCRVMLYSGDDVYAAAAKGKDAARDWCTNHDYTYQYISEDRRYTFPTCGTDARFYYSCSKCGKCEYNPNHTFYPTAGSFDNGEDGGLHTACTYTQRVPTDEHFLGLNANGDRVYLYVCEHCGKDWRQKDLGRTYEESVALTGPKTREEYELVQNRTKEWWSEGGVYYERSLEQTTVGHDGNRGTYAVAADRFVTARTSGWAKTGVQEAANNNLVDRSILGGDYTKTITRQQFCSVAVKLAEELLGKAITPAPSGTFTDTDSEYVRKASAAGITSGVGDGRFDPDGSLTRQQMAALLYRALMYVKDNSDTEYTIYESRLGSYTDAGQLYDWAKEPMAFMNALGLISGTSGTTLSPNDSCTIEQALIVANRSLDAGRIGWYQFVQKGSDWLHYGDRLWVYFKNGEACCMNPYGFESVLYIDKGGFRPIKDRS